MFNIILNILFMLRAKRLHTLLCNKFFIKLHYFFNSIYILLCQLLNVDCAYVRKIARSQALDFVISQVPLADCRS